MNRILISVVLMLSFMGCVLAADEQSGLVMQPGGNPTSSSVTVSQYSQYYTMQNGPAPKTHIEAPIRQVTKGTPAMVYFGYEMQAVPYTQYQTYATYTGGNSLWIQGPSSWTQFAKVPQGASLSLVATSATGGNGYLYEITPDGQLYKNSYYFYQGNDQINFYADSIGQHILLFAINGQVSNAIVIEVASYEPSYQQPVLTPIYTPIQPIYMPNHYPFISHSTVSSQSPVSSQPPVSSQSPVQSFGDTPVHLLSQGMIGSKVFLDGAYIGNVGSDGTFYFWANGGQNHEIRVYDSQHDFKKTMYFPSGVLQTLQVEPGKGIYT